MTPLQSRIRLALCRSQNGVVAELMGGQGGAYVRNYGVSLVEIRRVAAAEAIGASEAEELWLTGVRELMLLAVLALGKSMEGVDEPLLRWAPGMRTQEVVQLSSMELHGRLSSPEATVYRLLAQPGEWSLPLSAGLVARRLMSGEAVEALCAEAVLDKCRSMQGWGPCLSWAAGLLLRQCAADEHLDGLASELACDLGQRGDDPWAQRAAMEWRLQTAE